MFTSHETTRTHNSAGREHSASIPPSQEGVVVSRSNRKPRKPRQARKPRPDAQIALRIPARLVGNARDAKAAKIAAWLRKKADEIEVEHCNYAATVKMRLW